MNKGTLFLLFFVVLLGAGVAIGSVFLQGRTEHVVPPLKTTELSSVAQKESVLVNLVVEDIEYEMRVAPGSSAYDVMVQAQETSDLSFKGSEFVGLGFFVEEIKGLRQNPRAGKYWIYYINGEAAKVGISVYRIKTNDVILWKYEKEHE